MAYATEADVAARFIGTLTESQESVIPALLDDAESLIQQRITDLDAQVTAGTVKRSVVVKVESWAVIRHLRNPEGKYQESIDDYSFTRDKAVSEGALYITDDEWDELLSSQATSSAFTIRSDAEWAPTWSPFTAWI